jgi:hypothetical protein
VTNYSVSATVTPGMPAGSVAALATAGECHALRKLDVSHCGARDVGAACIAVIMAAGNKLEKVQRVLQVMRDTSHVAHHTSHITRHTSHVTRLSG